MAISDSAKQKRFDGLVDDLQYKRGYVNFQVMTDFKLYGNMLNNKFTRIGYEEIAKYYGLPHIANWPDRLKKQRVFCHHCGSLTSFMNDSETNGQGMENGIWQLLLGAIPYANAEHIASAIPNLDASDVIKLVFFQDDHNFSLSIREPKSPKGGRKKWEADTILKLKTMFRELWLPFGHNLQMDKFLFSKKGYVLLGTLSTENGVRPYCTKGIDAALRKCSHRAPGILEILASVESAFAASLKGCNYLYDMYPVFLYCVAYTLIFYLPPKARPDTKAVAVKYVAPRVLGGLGGIVPSNAVPGGCWFSDDERIHTLFYHIAVESDYAMECRSVLYAGAAEGNIDVRQWAANPVIRPNNNMKCKSSNLVNRVIKTLGGKRFKDYSKCEAHYEQLIGTFLSTVSVCPTTVLSAAMQNHPATVMRSEMNFMCQSSSAAVLIGREQVEKEMVSMRIASIQYLLNPLVQESGYKTWFETLDYLEYPTEFPTTTGLPRCSVINAVEKYGGLKDEFIISIGICRRYKGQLLHSSGKETTIPTQHIFLTPARAAIATYTDVVNAMTKVNGGRPSAVEAVMRSAYANFDPKALTKMPTPDRPFTHLSRLSATPPLDGAGFMKMYSAYNFDVDSLSRACTGMDLQINFGVLYSGAIHELAGVDDGLRTGNYAVNEAVISCLGTMSFYESTSRTKPPKALMAYKNDLTSLIDMVGMVGHVVPRSSYYPNTSKMQARQTLGRHMYMLKRPSTDVANMQVAKRHREDDIMVDNAKLMKPHIIIETWLAGHIIDNGHMITKYNALVNTTPTICSVSYWSALKKSHDYLETLPGKSSLSLLSAACKTHGMMDDMVDYLRRQFNRYVTTAPPEKIIDPASLFDHVCRNVPLYWTNTEEGRRGCWVRCYRQPV
jgi:hypothetical protein